MLVEVEVVQPDSAAWDGEVCRMLVMRRMLHCQAGVEESP